MFSQSSQPNLLSTTVDGLFLDSSTGEVFGFFPDAGNGNAALGINPKFASPSTGGNCNLNSENNCKNQEKKHQKKLKFRAWLAMRQRQEVFKAGLASQFKSLVACGRLPVPAFVRKKTGETVKTGSPGKVQLSYYGAGFDDEKSPVAFTWVKRCASPMLCFMDAPKIRYYRSQQVQQICKIMLERGYSWQFWTFTAPHDLNTDPDEQVKKFSEAFRFLKAGKAWQTFSNKLGLEFQIRAIEMTDDSPTSGYKTGCHFHYHIIAFFKRNKVFSKKELSEIDDFISTRWVASLKKFGLCSDEKEKDALKVAFRLDVPRQPKDKNASLDEVASYMSKGASIEMTPGIFTKNGKVPARISHWEVMALALTRFPSLVPRMLSIMKALKGRHWLHFDKNLLEFCNIKDLKDDEILQEKKAPEVITIENEDWRQIDNFKSQPRVIENIISDCEDHGVDLSDLPRTEKELKDAPAFDLLRDVSAFTVQTFALGYDSRTGESLADLLKDPPGFVAHDCIVRFVC